MKLSFKIESRYPDFRIIPRSSQNKFIELPFWRYWLFRLSSWLYNYVQNDIDDRTNNKWSGLTIESPPKNTLEEAIRLGKEKYGSDLKNPFRNDGEDSRFG